MNQLAPQSDVNASLNERIRLFGTVAGGEFIVDERSMYIHPLPITSGAEDRSGERIDPDGIITASYEQNPVIFFAHSHKFMPLVPPVGQAINPDGKFDCFREGDIWKSGCLFSQATKFAGQLFALVAEGTIRGRSIGATAHGFAPYKPTLPGMVFHQGEIRPTKTRSVVCTKAELFEWSWTPLPQNRDMVIALKSMMSHGRVDGQTLDPVLGEILKSMDLFEPAQSHGYGPGLGFASMFKGAGTETRDDHGRWSAAQGTGASSAGTTTARRSHKDHRDDFHGQLNDHSKGRVTAEGDNEVHGSSHVRNVVRAHAELNGMTMTPHEGGETHEDKHGNKIVLSKRGNKHVATFHAAEGKSTARPLTEPKPAADAPNGSSRPLNEAHGQGDTNTRPSTRPIPQNGPANAALEDQIDHHRRRLTRMRSNGLHAEADAEHGKIQDLRRQVAALNTPRAPGEGVRPVTDSEGAKPAPAAAPVVQQDEHATLAHHKRQANEMAASGQRDAAAQHRVQAALTRRRIAGADPMYPAPAASPAAENENAPAADQPKPASSAPKPASTRAGNNAEPLTERQATQQRTGTLGAESHRMANETYQLTRNGSPAAQNAYEHAEEAEDHAFDGNSRSAAGSHRRAAGALRTEAAGLVGPAADKYDRLAERHEAHATAHEAGLPPARSFGLSDATIARERAARSTNSAANRPAQPNPPSAPKPSAYAPRQASSRAEYEAEPITPGQRENRRMEPLREESAKLGADTARLTGRARTRTAEEAGLHASEADGYASQNKPRKAAVSHRAAAAALRTEAAGLDGPAADKHDRLAERHEAHAKALEEGLPQQRSFGLSDATIARDRAARALASKPAAAKPKAAKSKAAKPKESADSKPAALTKKSNYEAGEKVEFTFRGKRVEGTVLRNREVRRSGRTRDLARQVTGNPNSLNQSVIEISGPNGTYTVGHDAIHGTRGRGDLRAAQDAHSGIRRSRAEQASNNRNTADSKIGHIEIGQPIQVRFRDSGWQTVTYKGVVPGSGNVRYEQNGRTRTTHADAVRDPNAGSAVEKSLDGNSSASFYKGDSEMLGNQMILGVVFDHGTTPAEAAQFLKSSTSFLIDTPITLDSYTMMLKSHQVDYEGDTQQIQDEDFPGVRFIIAKGMDTDEEDAGDEDGDEGLEEETNEVADTDDRPAVVADPQAPIVKAKPGARWCSAMSSGLAELHKMATAALDDVERSEILEEAGKSLGILTDMQTVLADLSSTVYPSGIAPAAPDADGGTHADSAKPENDEIDENAEIGEDGKPVVKLKKTPPKPPEREVDAETLKAMFYHDRVFVPSPLVGAIGRIARGEGQDAIDRARDFLTRSLLKGFMPSEVEEEPLKVTAADRVNAARERLALQRFEASKRRLELHNNS